MSSVLFDTSGVTATRLIDIICLGKIITISEIDEVYHGKLSASKDDLFEACNGLVEEHHIYMLGAIRCDITQTQVIILELNGLIKRMLSPYDNVSYSKKVLA